MWNWAISIKDGKGKTSTMGGYLATAATLAQALASVNTLATLVGAETEGRVTKVLVTQAGTLPAANPAVPDPLSQVEEKGLFTFRCSNEKVTQISIPTFDHESHMVPNKDDIDLTDAGVAAVVAHLLDAGAFFTDSNGASLATLESAKVTF